MIGEIRDKETAQIAFRASVTGHLVLSTVHTNDAAGAVTRLIDLGLEPFMVASSLISVVSMRLVRTLCTRCQESYEIPTVELNRLGARDLADGTVTISRGRGCQNCRETGYSGRLGIFELLEITDSIRQLITQGGTDTMIRHHAREAGMRSIGEDGLKKVMSGITSVEEIGRVVYLAETGARICSHCSTVAAQEYDYCTSCGEFVADHCESCKRRVSPDWAFCPFCGKPGAAFASGEGEEPSDRATASPRARRRLKLGATRT